MLEAIRKRSGSIVVKALLGLLVLSFGVWGIGDFLTGRTQTTAVAEVGGVEIQGERLRTEVQREMARLRPLFGKRFDITQARSMGVVNAVLGSIINDTLFTLGADDLGVTISDRAVRDAIRKNPAFRNVLGQFDRNVFNQVLQSNGLSEQGYIARLRRQMAREQLLGSVAAGAAAPKPLVEALYRYRQEKRVAETVLVADAAQTGIGEPDEDALARFHEKYAARFTAPEQRSLTVVRLDAEDLAKEIAVSEADLKEAYDEREDEFNQPEQRHLQQMVLADEATAKKAYGLLGKGEDFAKVAKDVAGLKPDALDLGMVDRSRLLPELAAVAFALPKDGFSKPVKSPLGWHIVRVLSIEPARKQTLDEVRDRLKAEIAKDKAIDGLFDLSNKLEDALAGGATLEEAAGELNLRLVKIPSIDRKGRDAAGKPVADLPPGGRFLEIAFETPEGAESELTEAGAEGYFVVRVDQVTPATLRPLASVRDQVIAAWKAEKRKEAAEKSARAILQRLRDGAALSTVAAEYGLTVETTGALARQQAANGLPRELVAKLFAVKPGEATMARGAKGFYVARLKEVKTADPGADRAGVGKLAENVTAAVRNDLIAELAGALRGDFAVTVNTRVIDRLYASQ